MEKAKGMKEIRISSGIGREGDKEFKRYAALGKDAKMITDALMATGSKGVKVSAIGKDAVFNAVKAIGQAKESINKIHQYASIPTEVIITDFGYEKIDFKRGDDTPGRASKGISNYFILEMLDLTTE